MKTLLTYCIESVTPRYVIVNRLLTHEPVTYEDMLDLGDIVGTDNLIEYITTTLGLEEITLVDFNDEYPTTFYYDKEKNAFISDKQIP